MMISVRVGHRSRPRGITVGAFGDKFRQERERRGFTLDDVSNVTRIGSRMLKAIEDEHFDQLPGGIFNKGFIRAYARHLGLDEQEAITEYLSAVRQAQVDAQNAWAAGQPAPPRVPAAAHPAKSRIAGTARGPAIPAQADVRGEAEELPGLQLPRAEHIRPRPPAFGRDGSAIPWKVPALVVLLVLIGIVLWNRHSRGARAEAENPAPAAASSPAPPSGGLPAETTAKAAGSAQPAAPQSGATSTSPSSAPASDPADQNDVTTRNLRPLPAASTTPEPAPAFRLVIRAAESSWISVIADGQQLTQETLIAPAHTSVRASREIIVKAGNAAGVSFLFNGKEIPASGAEGEVKTFLFDAQGMRLVAAGPASDPVR